MNDVSLRDFLAETGVTKFEYLCDFGDFWEHVVHTGKIQYGKVGALDPKLTKVRGRCPPEDVSDTQEEWLRHSVNEVAKLIQRGKPAHEYFGFDSSESAFL